LKFFILKNSFHRISICFELFNKQIISTTE